MEEKPGEPLESERRERRWPRALALFVAVLVLGGVFQTLVLIGVPLAFLIMAGPGESRRGMNLICVTLLAVIIFSGAPSGAGLWYVERGWALLLAGCFILSTLVWPTKTFTARALGAVAGALVGGTAIYLVWPGGWQVTDWMVSSRIGEAASGALQAMQLLTGDAGLSPALVAAIHQTADFQERVFPALLALSSLAALGVAWWFYGRLVHGTDQGLGALRDFRFNDQLVWVLIGGIVLLLWGGAEGVQRAGTNAVVFMTTLYALRGTAVAMSLSGGFSLLGYMLLGTALLLAAPLIFAGALVIGLGDTWLDVRARATATAGGMNAG